MIRGVTNSRNLTNFQSNRLITLFNKIVNVFLKEYYLTSNKQICKQVAVLLKQIVFIK